MRIPSALIRRNHRLLASFPIRDAAVRRTTTMFAFFSSRLGCIGSIIVSVAGTVLLIILLRGCGG